MPTSECFELRRSGAGGGTTGGEGSCSQAGHGGAGGGQDTSTGSGQHLNGSNNDASGGGGGGGFVGGGSRGSCGGGGGSGFIASGIIGTTTQGAGSTGDAQVTITYTPPCPAGQAFHALTATTNVGTISGFFCVNPSTGIGTYKQDSMSGTGIVEQHPGTTQVDAFGTNLNLAGNQFGSLNRFAETAPVTAFGTFSLS